MLPAQLPSGPGRIAVIVPCFNEEAAVGVVVDDLRAALPDAVIYVYDNASTDATAEVAARHGAVVRREATPGKGNVVRRAFADVDADTYVIVDGDDTYDASAAGHLVDVLLSGPYDHVVGARRAGTLTAYRRGHAAGNRGLNRAVSAVFGTPVTDMLSGYRVMSRRFVKSFPALSRGFEVETELTVHAVNLRVPQVEVPVGFKDRPEGSESKLRTYRDGTKILSWIARLAHYERPVAVHAVLAAAIVAVALALGAPVVVEFARTGLVPRFPTAILASSLVVVAALVMTVGVVLDAVHRTRHEATRLAYLRYPAPGVPGLGPVDLDAAAASPLLLPRRPGSAWRWTCGEPVRSPAERVGGRPARDDAAARARAARRARSVRGVRPPGDAALPPRPALPRGSRATGPRTPGPAAVRRPLGGGAGGAAGGAAGGPGGGAGGAERPGRAPPRAGRGLR